MNEAEELSNLTTMAFKEGFQKGKLEAIKDTKMFLKLRIEQLQKEIGDDSQQPRRKQTRGGELKSDEGLHSTDNGSPADTFSELWDNPEDDRWDKEYNPDLLPETLKNKEEKQDEK